MADDVARHRQFLPYGSVTPTSAAERLRWKHLGFDQYNTAENRARDRRAWGIEAFGLPKLAKVLLLEKPDQEFLRGATLWEQVYSAVANHAPAGGITRPNSTPMNVRWTPKTRQLVKVEPCP